MSAARPRGAGGGARGRPGARLLPLSVTATVPNPKNDGALCLTSPTAVLISGGTDLQALIASGDFNRMVQVPTS